MGLLVFGGNFFVTMLGWDGLGITSFFLVVFYQRVISGVSGLITVYTNRVGDVLFLFVFG
jgi:NADH-ubiquinone oxidoreductase chain 5